MSSLCPGQSHVRLSYAFLRGNTQQSREWMNEWMNERKEVCSLQSIKVLILMFYLFMCEILSLMLRSHQNKHWYKQEFYKHFTVLKPHGRLLMTLPSSVTVLKLAKGSSVLAECNSRTNKSWLHTYETYGLGVGVLDGLQSGCHVSSSASGFMGGPHEATDFYIVPFTKHHVNRIMFSFKNLSARSQFRKRSRFSINFSSNWRILQETQ